MKTYNERMADVSARVKFLKKRKKIIKSVSLTMACLTLALILFVPYNTNPPSVKQYADSPYYDLIQKINLVTYNKPKYKNNFDALVHGLDRFSNLLGGVAGDAMAPESINGASIGDYVEVTDNQVSGIIEADIFKRSTEHVYYLRGNQLYVYTIAGEDSQLVSSYTVAEYYKYFEVDLVEEKEFFYSGASEMYLSSDCTTIIIVINGYHSAIGSCTTLMTLDVTDPGNIVETNRVYVTGSYLSSRMVDGKLLLMSNFRVTNDKDFSDESTFLPQIGTADSMTTLAPEDIIAPEELSNARYTVVCSIDAKTLTIHDSAAFLSFSDDIYVSNDNIYASRNYRVKTENSTRTVTEIACLNYSGETLEFTGSVTLDGAIKDQYSMDEYEGILRVVTSLNETVSFMDNENAWAQTSQGASLYCVSLETFEVIASVEKFAPDNETAESVRFDGPMAYVCTAEVIELTDPVFFFDLSDLENITYTDTGTIDGYSSSLVNLGDGFLLGIGYGDDRQMKIEVYERVGDSVVSVCSYEMNATISNVYKSYFIDRDKDFVGLAVCNWQDGREMYLLLHFDGYELRPILAESGSFDTSNVRAFMADGYFYILGCGEVNKYLQVHKIG